MMTMTMRMRMRIMTMVMVMVLVIQWEKLLMSSRGEPVRSYRLSNQQIIQASHW